MERLAFSVFQEDGPHVATVRLTQPEIGNSLQTDDIRELGRAILAAGSEPDIKVVLVRADGDHFCLGRNPGPGAPSLTSALQIRSGITDPILGFYADLRATPVPVVAVVRGEARGFGCAFVGQCDLAIAADTARFSLPEMDTNLPPTLAISALLGKVPPKQLMHLVYTRQSIGAADALALGLLSEVVPRAELEAVVALTISRLTDRRRPALVAVKEYLAVAPHVDPVAASRYASALLSVVLSSKSESNPLVS